MEIVSVSHVYMEKEVLDPYCSIDGAIVRFYIDGLKPFWKLMSHYPVCKTDRVGWTSESGGIPLVVGEIRL